MNDKTGIFESLKNYFQNNICLILYIGNIKKNKLQPYSSINLLKIKNLKKINRTVDFIDISNKKT